MMQEIGRSAGAFAACSTVHVNIFGLHSIVKHGTDRQRAAWLPAIIDGSSRACFGVTEPDAGLDTSRIKTRAVRDGDHYVINGQKIWTSTAQQADKVVLLARTAPLEHCAKPTDGLRFSTPTSIARPWRFAKSQRWGATPSTRTRPSTTI
jgi:acyl-CoA dehydrogenase